MLVSVVLLEQVRTIKQNELDEYIGIVYDETLQNTISNSFRKTFGRWERTARSEVRCLCNCCMQEYIDTRTYIISRLNPFQKQKENCDRCGKPGYDYTLRKRRNKF